jgi:hypothetical protein
VVIPSSNMMFSSSLARALQVSGLRDQLPAHIAGKVAGDLAQVGSVRSRRSAPGRQARCRLRQRAEIDGVLPSTTADVKDLASAPPRSKVTIAGCRCPITHGAVRVAYASSKTASQCVGRSAVEAIARP